MRPGDYTQGAYPGTHAQSPQPTHTLPNSPPHQYQPPPGAYPRPNSPPQGYQAPGVYPPPTGYGPPPGAVPAGKVLAQYGDLEGQSPEQVRAMPHRMMNAEELRRYGLPEGTLMMATQQESQGNMPIAPMENMAPYTNEQDQIRAYMASQGLTPWTGPKAATFASTGQPVPPQIQSMLPAPIPHLPDGAYGTLQGAWSPTHARSPTQQYPRY